MILVTIVTGVCKYDIWLETFQVFEMPFYFSAGEWQMSIAKIINHYFFFCNTIEERLRASSCFVGPQGIRSKDDPLYRVHFVFLYQSHYSTTTTNFYVVAMSTE
jgi:hypothetical protein